MNARELKRHVRKTLPSLGGKALLKKHGPEYFRDLVAKRKDRKNKPPSVKHNSKKPR